MKKINSAKITFPSLSVNEGMARSFLTAFMMQLNPTVEEISDLKCAVSEAVTNSIVHGYKGKVGSITLTLDILDGGTVRAVISDRGEGIADVKRATEPLFTTNTDGERSGMGFTVMETFTDKMKVRSRLGHGTKVTLTKKIGI